MTRKLDCTVNAAADDLEPHIMSALRQTDNQIALGNQDLGELLVRNAPMLSELRARASATLRHV